MNISEELNTLITNWKKSLQIEIQILECKYKKDMNLSFWPISCTKKIGFSPLIDHLPKLGITEQIVQKEVVKLIDKILEERFKNPIVETKILHGWIKNILGIEEKDCSNYVQQLHNWGYILHFPFLEDKVIIHPQWLADLFKSIISYKNEEIVKNGTVIKKIITDKLQTFRKENVDDLLNIFKNFNILIEHSNGSHYVIPCLLSTNVPELEEAWKSHVTSDSKWILE